MSELSVFIDEPGDFGSYEHHAPYYIITLVFHDQSSDISEQIKHLRRHLVEQGFAENHAIHSAPLIRRERGLLRHGPHGVPQALPVALHLHAPVRHLI